MYKSFTKIVTFRPTAIILLVLLVCLVSVTASASILTTITVKEMDGVSTSNYPLTFGHVFKKGDVADNVYLNNYPTQTDVKTTYDDGSIRFAVISALVPMTANSDTVLNINTTGTAASTTPMTQTEILATDIGATIDLTGLSGSGYSGDLQADLRATITAASSLDYWLSGDVCTEILIDEKLNNSLNATWEVRFYPGTSYIRISHVMENVEADYRGNINYAVEIKQGYASPTSVYTKADFQHNINSRWRKVYWLDREPPEVEIHYDIDYLISTGMIPNYDTSLTIPEATLASAYSGWQASDHDIMENGIVNYYFPQTGGRQEIGIYPTWSARYLLSMDNRLREVMLNSAEMTAGCPMHYRESDNTKSFYGKFISIDDRPDIWTTEYRLANGFSGGLPIPIGETSTPWTIDRAHQGSFSYLPYVITGDYFYLQEMLFWAGYDLSASDANSTYGRDGATGLIRDQTRGEAWAIRNISDAAMLVPDTFQEKTYLNGKITNNINQWEIDILRYPLRYWDLDTYATHDNMTSDVKYITPPWMCDFMSIVLEHMRQMGFSVGNINAEFSKFTIGRFSADGFNKYNGAPYRFPGKYTDGTYPQTWSQANSSFVVQGTTFLNTWNEISAENYTVVALAALSGLVNYPFGKGAYEWLKSEIDVATNMPGALSDDPTYALIPIGPASPKSLRIE